ncbi:MAG: ChaN family lipoprotein [Proteobacteria bacterium]|nr:ChaN family lipoprotein [Pseudomonadota bacterium]MDA1331299.1 ChaN family lipoprotein [Pseudomonadota bacterium]
MQNFSLSVIAVKVLIVISLSLSQAWSIDLSVSCNTPGTWVIPGEPDLFPVNYSAVLSRADDMDFILLGEQHDQAQHHRWQTQMLSALLAHKDHIAIGLEMLPRASQPALDAWVNGDLTLKEFLSQSNWYHLWRFDVELYTPILNFARDNQVPLYALNISRELISEVSTNGWQVNSSKFNRIISEPAPASPSYQAALTDIFYQHEGSDNKQLEYFIAAQLTWDRAFAEGLIKAKKDTSRVVVGILGSGHLTYGYGVKHQLNSIGEFNILTWIPTTAGIDCTSLDLIDEEGKLIADAIFIMPEIIMEKKKHQLGIFLIDSDNGIVVGDVLKNSIAAESGLQTNDIIVEAAGQVVLTSADLIELIQNQVPGYWLPIKVKRNDQSIDLIAKIPFEGISF